MKVNIGKYPKGAGHQKIDVQIERHDTYSTDHTLAHIIYPMLLQLKDTKHGVPAEFADVGGEDYSSQRCFDFYNETQREAFDEGCKRWDEILDKMIWSFEQLVKSDYDSQYHHGKPNWDWIKTDEKFFNPMTNKLEETYQIVDKNPKEHWYDHEGHMLHEDRIQEGLELFGKYFRNLWD